MGRDFFLVIGEREEGKEREEDGWEGA